LSPSPIGFGIVGLGMIADFHAQAIAASNGGRLVAIATRNADKRRAFAQKHHVPATVTSVEELVARPDIDVVCITTPTGAHLEPALAAIRAGKHLVIEKALEITTERVDAILSAAEAAGVKVAPIFQTRFARRAPVEGRARGGAVRPARARERLREVAPLGAVLHRRLSR